MKVNPKNRKDYNFLEIRFELKGAFSFFKDTFLDLTFTSGLYRADP